MIAFNVMRYVRAALVLLACALAIVMPEARSLAADNPNSVVYTKHNLSSSGLGEVRSATEAEICIFCHAPHTALSEAPLWNHQMPVTGYTPYSSATLIAKVGQPTGSSRLCLSCHDGTVALGLVGSRRTPIPMIKGYTTIPPGPSRLGTDLTGHHPVSFTYDSALAIAKGELEDPSKLQGRVRLDTAGQLQCTSCHDPHSDQNGKFLVENNTASALCVECHALNNWSSSVHAISPAGWNGTGRNPWPNSKSKTVAANGCENCHASHAAGVQPHLLKFAKPEDNCLVCHNGSVAAKNIEGEFNKKSAHGLVSFSSPRDAAQGPVKASEPHVACVDCHDPHTVGKATAASGSAPAALGQVKGVAADGAVVKIVTHEYELCFRCHAGTSALGNSKAPRQFMQPNIRLQFEPANASYHPVMSAAKSASDPTLMPPWTGARQMLCSDCHNNDQGPGARGTGPKGPHGSRYAPLLERNLVTVDFQAESVNAYALCYKCHSEGVLMADPLHGKHVREQRTSCSTCHDAHGVQTQKHLVNFNTIYVTASSAGRLEYVSTGKDSGNCSLTCHGKDHKATPYGLNSMSVPLLKSNRRR